jgi:hypothetical protein
MQRLLFLVTWILVLTPLSWGVARSIQKSMPLFTTGALIKPIQAGSTTHTNPPTSAKP